MGFLDILAGVGGGLEGGSRAADAIEKRRRERAEEERVAKEFEQAQADRLGLRKSLHGLYDSERADESDANAFELESAGQAVDDRERGYGEIDLPFAGTFKKAGDQIRETGKQPSTFDPNIPYDKLITIQGQRRDAKTRASERRGTLARQQEELALRKRTTQNAETTAARKVSEAAVMRAELKRLALARKVDVSPAAVDGMSDADVQSLVTRSATGNLGTDDYRDRRTIQIQMPTPKSGAGANDNIGLGDLNTTVANRYRQIDQLRENAPQVVKDAFGGGEIPSDRDAILAAVKKHLSTSDMGTPGPWTKEREAARVAALGPVAGWLTKIQGVEQLIEEANRQADELVRSGVKRGTGGQVPTTVPAPAAAPKAPAPPAAKPPAPDDKAKEDAYRAARRAGKTHEEAVRIAEGG